MYIQYPELPSSLTRMKMKGTWELLKTAFTNCGRSGKQADMLSSGRLHQRNCPHRIRLFFRKVKDNCEVSKSCVLSCTLQYNSFLIVDCLISKCVIFIKNVNPFGTHTRIDMHIYQTSQLIWAILLHDPIKKCIHGYTTARKANIRVAQFCRL